MRCLAVEGGFFQARGVITDVQHGGGPDAPGPEMFVIEGYDSGRHSTEPDYYDVFYFYEPNSLPCQAPTTTSQMAPIHDSDIDVRDDH